MCDRIQVSKNEISRLVTALQLPYEIECGVYNDLRVSSVEALCVILKGLAFPCRYSDMMPRFGRPVPQLSMICNETIHWLGSRWGFKLSDLNQQWLTPQNLMCFSNSIYEKGAALNNVWGFVDCTWRGIASPVQNQRVTYNGHKLKHGLKYQSITTLNGIITNLFGPVKG